MLSPREKIENLNYRQNNENVVIGVPAEQFEVKKRQ